MAGIHSDNIHELDDAMELTLPDVQNLLGCIADGRYKDISVRLVVEIRAQQSGSDNDMANGDNGVVGGNDDIVGGDNDMMGNDNDTAGSDNNMMGGNNDMAGDRRQHSTMRSPTPVTTETPKTPARSARPKDASLNKRKREAVDSDSGKSKGLSGTRKRGRLQGTVPKEAYEPWNREPDPKVESLLARLREVKAFGEPGPAALVDDDWWLQVPP